MKEIINSKRPNDPIYIDDLKPSDHIGFLDSEGRKGHIVHIGGSRLCAISMYDPGTICNSSYGDNYENACTCIVSALNIDKRSVCWIQGIYVFDTLKDLYKWLSE